MTTKIKWRLKERPTPDEVTELFKHGLLTKDEAREILFSLENDEDRTKESLQEEIKFLRELVQKLSSDRAQIVKTIEYVQVPYKKYDWYQPYQVYCSNGSGGGRSLGGGGGGSGSGGGSLTGNNGIMYTTSGSASTLTASYSVGSKGDDSFTGISTF